MKLLVIVLCLLSERFLIHAVSQQRMEWFATYYKIVANWLPKKLALANAWLVLVATILPLLVTAGFVFYLFGNVLYGFIALLLNILVFYCCLGPVNPFYPLSTAEGQEHAPEAIGEYLAVVNGQLFAVIFWYIVLGPLGVLAYRLISLSQNQETIHKQALWLTNVLDWIPAKITALFYLLVGNFQAGFQHFSKLFFTAPEHNQAMLRVCGMHAVGYEEREVFLPQAETLVEHAVIALLVFLAFFTMAAWL